MKAGSSLTPSMSLRLSKHADDDDLESEGIPLRRQESLRTTWYSYILCFLLCHSYKNIKHWGATSWQKLVFWIQSFYGNLFFFFFLLVPHFGFTMRLLAFGCCILYTISPWSIQKGLAKCNFEPVGYMLYSFYRWCSTCFILLRISGYFPKVVNWIFRNTNESKSFTNATFNS